MQEILKVENLIKTFVQRKIVKKKIETTKTKAVDGISFSLKKGEILGLLGPNGAGKTTTISMLMGSLSPTFGKISYFGQEFDGEDSEILKRINFSSTYIKLPASMTVWENLDVYAKLYEVSNHKVKIKKLLERFGIEKLVKAKFNQLSEGQKTRVVLAKAFLNYPEVILLDEPTASLDPEVAKIIREFLLEQQKEHKVSMLFTSHNMKEVQEICDRIIFIDKGKIVAEDTPIGLVKRFEHAKVRFRIQEGQQALEKYMKEKKFKPEWQKGKFTFEIKETAIPKVLFKLSNLGVRYQELEIIRPDLEDFFLLIAGKKEESSQGKDREIEG